MQKIWQEYWEINETGRHLYNIEKHVGLGRKLGAERQRQSLRA